MTATRPNRMPVIASIDHGISTLLSHETFMAGNGLTKQAVYKTDLVNEK